MIALVTGATGEAGRAVCARLGERDDTVIAVGTDAGHLAAVDAAERRVADLTDAAASGALLQGIADEHGRIDAVLHLVGGWKPGDTAEADAWLRPRLVDSLANVIRAAEPLLAASGGRLAIVSSTAVAPGTPATSSYARAKAEAEALVTALGTRLAAHGGATAVFVVRSLGEQGTPASALAERVAEWLDAPAAEISGSRIVLGAAAPR